MKGLLPFYVMYFLILLPAFGEAQVVDIPDDEFLRCLIDRGHDENGDGLIQESEGFEIKSLSIWPAADYDIKTFEGIESFSNLKSLLINKKDLSVKNLDLSENNKLNSIDLFLDSIVTLELPSSGNTSNLINLNCQRLNKADINGFYNLDRLIITGVDTITFDSLPELSEYYITDSKKYPMNGYKLPKVNLVKLTKDSTTSIKINGFSNLQDLDINSNGTDSILVRNTNASSVRIRQNKSVNYVKIAHSSINNITLDHNSHSRVQIDSIDNTYILQISNSQNLDSFSLINCSECKELRLENLSLVELDIENSQDIEEIVLKNLPNYSFDLKRIDHLKFLYVDHGKINKFNLDSFPVLEKLFIENSSIKQFDFSGNDKLKWLGLRYNDSLSNVKVDSFTNMSRLYVEHNSIDTLSVTNNFSLDQIQIFQNGEFIKYVDIKNIETPSYIKIANADTFNLTNIPKLRSLWIYYNPHIETLKLNNYSHLKYIRIPNCPKLKHLEINNIGQLSTFTLNKTKPETICLDSFNNQVVIEELLKRKNEECALFYNCPTSYKSYYELKGTAKFSPDQISCDSGIVTPNIGIRIESDSQNYRLLTSKAGYYNTHVATEDTSILLIPEAPEGFVISPDTVVQPIESSETIITNNFCLKPEGIYSDVSINIIPIDDTRPGNISKYKIILKNKGNQEISGTFNMSYQDALMEFDSSTFSPEKIQDGRIVWNYDFSTPFQQLETTVAMQLNTPVDNPPLTQNDTLEFVAEVLSIDDNEKNNISILHDPVVNSFDPNDKKCLDGNILSYERIGDYVNYKIRFENTGNAAAIDIEVKDTIDTEVYDISSLQIVDASHPMETMIKGNVVTFTFDDIILPFEDDENDGYLIFKIKTRVDLQKGDKISNNAAIYFDYNPAIITNTSITTFKDLVSKIGDEEISLKIFPNPTDGYLNIQSELPMYEMSIREVSGKTVYEKDLEGRSSFHFNKNLHHGIYIIEITTEAGDWISKVVVH